MFKSILIATTCLFIGLSFAKAAETNFQKNSESVVEETTQYQEDGGVKKTTRSGKVKARQGEPRVGEIEDDEINQVVRRQKTLNFTVFGFGPYASSNVGSDKMLYGFTYGKHWEVSTTGEIFMDVLAALNDKGSMWNGSLGFSYIPMTGQYSPIVGGAFGFAYANGNTEGKGGFSGQLSGGYRMFRLSETQMEILGTYNKIFTNIDLSTYGVQLRVLF